MCGSGPQIASRCQSHLRGGTRVAREVNRPRPRSIQGSLKVARTFARQTIADATDRLHDNHRAWIPRRATSASAVSCESGVAENLQPKPLRLTVDSDSLTL